MVRNLMLCVLVCLVGGISDVLGEVPTTQPAGPEEPKGSEETRGAGGPVLPHIRVDREKRVVELDAAVVRQGGEWLELLACTPGTREHETILTVAARPSHIHLAMIMIGLAPGHPMKWHYEDEKMRVTPPAGSAVSITLRYVRDGRTVEEPANEWVVNQKTGKTLEGDVWLFTGSAFMDLEDRKLYRADASGTVISLVHFGDDLLARQTEVTHMTDDAMWNANKDRVPPEGTAVTVILRASPVEKKEDDKAGPVKG